MLCLLERDRREIGGAEGNRTPDLLIANKALSHLSYSPTGSGADYGQRPDRMSSLRRVNGAARFAAVLAIVAGRAVHDCHRLAHRYGVPDRHRPADRSGDLELADPFQCRQYAPPLRQRRRPFPLWGHRAGPAADQADRAFLGRYRHLAADPDPPARLPAHPDPQQPALLMVMPGSPPLPFLSAGDGVRVRLRVQPRARRNRIDGLVAEADGGVALNVAVTAPPEDGEANSTVSALPVSALPPPAPIEAHPLSVAGAGPAGAGPGAGSWRGWPSRPSAARSPRP